MRKAMESGLAACAIAPAADFILARGWRGNVPQLWTKARASPA
jgi:hypothetical protein